MATNADKPAVAAKKKVKRRPVKKKAVKKSPVKSKRSVSKEASAEPKMKRVVKKKLVPPRMPDQDSFDASEVDSAAPTISEETAAAAPRPEKRAAVPSARAIQEAVTARTIRGVRGRDITSFLRQLIMMLDAGTPLLKSLKSLSRRGERQGIRDLVAGMTEYVEAGNPLWQAFARYKEFDPVFVNLIKASEASGTLTTVLARLVKYRSAREMMAKRVRNAMIYPVAVLSVCVAVLVIIAKVLIPEFVSMFEKFEIEIPPFTSGFITVSNMLSAYWLPGFVALGALGVVYKILVQNPVWRMRADRMKLRLPLIGIILQKNAIVDFTHTFALMLRSGLSMMATLDLCKNAMRNRAYVPAIQDMRESVERGEGLEQALRNAERSQLFPGVVVDMLITGEETGSIDVISDQIGDIYEQEVEIEVSSINETIQPVITVAMGFIVGIIVFALFSPLVSMVDQIAGGGPI